jgi:amino-acid N-acetyltransferase
MIIDQAQPYKSQIIELLAAEKLPVNDLPGTLDNFIVAIADAEVIGVAGLERYGSYGLLRSVVIRHDFRSQGIAAKLLRRIESLGSLKGLTELYLLTETAADYFERKAYHRITRDEVPAAVQHSSEFSHVCPQSAIVMKKLLS